MSIFLRITRHPVFPTAEEWLHDKFGVDLVVENKNIVFGEDPVGAVVELIKEFGDVVAIEVVAQLPTIARLLEAKREITVPILRAEYKRDSTGRVIVAGTDESGRGILVFDRYVRLLRVSIETAEL